jgi:predicted transposase/invertase (TIGR01784 family)
LYNWLQFFKTKKEEELEMLAANSPMIGKAVGILKKLSVDERTRMLAEKREMLRMDISASIKKGRAEGVMEGLERGLEQGLVRGRAEGEARGEARGEAKGRAEVVRNALKMKISVESIMTLTGLSRHEIEKLR